MEAAPKDGRYLLLGRPNVNEHGGMEGYWRNEGPGPEGWVASIDPDTPYPIEPTHWRPRPAQPAPPTSSKDTTA